MFNQISFSWIIYLPINKILIVHNTSFQLEA
jgi:hypothetical protein